MKVLIVHDRLDDEAGADALDVLSQVALVRGALDGLGHQSEVFVCDLDLEPLVVRLAEWQPEVVFNLVESLGGQERLIHLVPSLLEALDVPFTGSKAEAILASTNKARSKQTLAQACLPVPRGVRLSDLDRSEPGSGPFIVKSIWCHGSVGLDDGAVVDDPGRLREVLSRMEAITGGPCLAEAFLPGREFNVALLETADGLRVLPPAEIRFDRFPAGKPRLVGHAAKWDEGSFEYDNTPRSFDFEPQDEALLDRLGELATAAWRTLGTGGYARVDFRLDEAGDPVILELNVNPCLSADAGYAAALERAGIGVEEAVRSILDAALKRLE